MVVYQALYGDYKVYVRPYEMFVSEVDHEKYPEVTQKYRFERVELGKIETGNPEDRITQERSMELANEESRQREPNPYLMRFLDTDCYEIQMECLKYLAATASQSDLDSIYVVLDMKTQTGSVEEQVQSIRHYLSMQHHFDGARLR